DVLFVESNYLQSADARKLVSRYLEGGRGVVLVINRVTPAIHGFLRELGFDVEPESGGKAASERLQFVASNHPIFHPFMSPDYGDLRELKVSKYAAVKSSEATPLMFSEKGAPLFFQQNKFAG